MLKAPAVAAMLGLSARAVYDLADRGILPCYRLGAGAGYGVGSSAKRPASVASRRFFGR